MPSSNEHSGSSSPTNVSSNVSNSNSQSNGHNNGNQSGQSTNSVSNSIDLSYNVSISTIDISSNCVSIFDLSCDDTLPTIIPIVSDLSINTTFGIGYEITNQEGTGADGTIIDRVTFDTTLPALYDPDIHQNLSQYVETYDDALDPSGQTIALVNQIKAYAAEIQCDDFHGKGTIEDYTALFQAAGRIATETKHMELNIDIEGFNQFADAADELSLLFTGFITKLQNVNIINDIGFLTSISIALGKIVNLSNIFGKFKQTVFATTVIQLPKSAHDTKIVIEDVMGEINCAMKYINYFVSPTDVSLNSAALSPEEKNIINKSVETIDTWNILCEHGVSIAMSDNIDVKYIQQASNELKQTTNNLKSATNTLKSKLASYNIIC
jgi:hypothetical protein